MVNNFTKILFLFSTAIVFSACSDSLLNDFENVSFVIDAYSENEIPAEWEECTEWNVTYYIGKDCKKIPACIGKPFTVSLPKNQTTAFTAVPLNVENTENQLRENLCYGAIYPFNRTLSYKDGFTADIFNTIIRTSGENSSLLRDYLDHFNWKHLMEICRTFEKPWKLNRSKILEGICSGKFKKGDIRIVEN